MDLESRFKLDARANPWAEGLPNNVAKKIHFTSADAVAEAKKLSKLETPEEKIIAAQVCLDVQKGITDPAEVPTEELMKLYTVTQAGSRVVSSVIHKQYAPNYVGKRESADCISTIPMANRGNDWPWNYEEVDYYQPCPPWKPKFGSSEETGEFAVPRPAFNSIGMFSSGTFEMDPLDNQIQELQPTESSTSPTKGEQAICLNNREFTYGHRIPLDCCPSQDNCENVPYIPYLENKGYSWDNHVVEMELFATAPMSLEERQISLLAEPHLFDGDSTTSDELAEIFVKGKEGIVGPIMDTSIVGSTDICPTIGQLHQLYKEVQAVNWDEGFDTKHRYLCFNGYRKINIEDEPAFHRLKMPIYIKEGITCVPVYTALTNITECKALPSQSAAVIITPESLEERDLLWKYATNNRPYLCENGKHMSPQMVCFFHITLQKRRVTNKVKENYKNAVEAYAKQKAQQFVYGKQPLNVTALENAFAKQPLNVQDKLLYKIQNRYIDNVHQFYFAIDFPMGTGTLPTVGYQTILQLVVKDFGGEKHQLTALAKEKQWLLLYQEEAEKVLNDVKRKRRNAPEPMSEC